MTHYIQMGGENRPVRFGFSGLYFYEKQTGRKALADFAAFQDGLNSVSITHIVDLAHAGLVAGYKSEKRNVDFDLEDVAGWLDDGVLTEIMKAFAESFPQEGNAATGTAKKTPAPVA